jgi:hypothetical protein
VLALPTPPCKSTFFTCRIFLPAARGRAYRGSMSTLCKHTCLVALSFVLVMPSCAPDLTVSSSSSGGMGGSGGMGEASSSSASSSSGMGGSSSSSGSGLMLGADCNNDNECASGTCEDDVCCADDCSGDCIKCDVDGSLGTCTQVAIGTEECDAIGELCDANGKCACGVSVPPTGVNCPAPWINGPTLGSCVLQCDQLQECANTNTICPAGFDCIIECTGKDGCRDSTFTCPNMHKCSIVCAGNDNNACRNSIVNCSKTGPCDITCGVATDSCYNTTVACGENQCSATCAGGTKPNLVVASGSCGVQGC